VTNVPKARRESTMGMEADRSSLACCVCSKLYLLSKSLQFGTDFSNLALRRYWTIGSRVTRSHLPPVDS